jgi:hypothetical protein
MLELSSWGEVRKRGDARGTVDVVSYKYGINDLRRCQFLLKNLKIIRTNMKSSL